MEKCPRRIPSVNAWLSGVGREKLTHRFPGRFGEVDSWLILVHVFSRLDVRNLLQLLGVCRSFRDKFVIHDVEEYTAWRGLIETELPEQIKVLDACRRDLCAVLDEHNLKIWVDEAFENHGGGVIGDAGQTGHATRPFFDVFLSEAGHMRLATSFVELLKERSHRARADVGDALEWFLATVEGGLEDIMHDVDNDGQDSMSVVEKIRASDWFRDLESTIKSRREAAEDLRERLCYLEDVALFRTMVRWPVATGQASHVQDLIAKRADELRTRDAGLSAKGAGVTRSARPSAKRQRKMQDEAAQDGRKMTDLDAIMQCGRGEEDDAQPQRQRDAEWARGMLKCMLAWSVAREKKGRGTPRLFAQVVRLSRGADEVLPGEWVVDEAGHVQLVCSVAADVEVETWVRNFGCGTVALKVHFSSHSILPEESETYEGEPLQLKAGVAATCAFNDDVRTTRTVLKDKQTEDVWHVDAVPARGMCGTAGCNRLLDIRILKSNST